MEKENFIVHSLVAHKRLLPRINQFIYKVYYIFFDLSEMNSLKNWIFSLNRFNFFSFYNSDHGPKDGSSLEIWARSILSKENILADGKIFLHTHPRILGYCFNPVSFFYCFNKNRDLKAIIAQVNNTFGQCHNYLIFEKNGLNIDQNKYYEAPKNFHVSPFMNIEGTYRFRFVIDKKKVAAWIDYFDNKNNLMLATSMIGNKISYSKINLIKSFIIIPFVTFKVIIFIHIQALKLFFKKIKYISLPKEPINKITKSK